MGGCSSCQCLKEKSNSRWLILFVITVALVVDCILFTVVAPIAPAILYDIEYRKGNTTFQNSSGSYHVASYALLPDLSLFENSSKELYHDQIINSTESPTVKRHCYKGKEYLNNQNLRVGFLLSIKAIMQLLTNPIVVKLINRAGYDAPLFCGFIIVFFSCLRLSFIPSVVVYIICLNAFAGLAQKIGRWLCIMLGMIMQGISVMCMPLANDIFGLIGPDAFLGGPLSGGAIANTLGFNWLMIILGIINIAYAPLIFLLQNPPGKEETKMKQLGFFITVLSQEEKREQEDS
ncbi:hypothetical protein XELAEV_18020206mg [Xenopus laevis]|uniref:Major facilitator superfamily (MFS) profile domain-containing protein n=1 Tax=Xenopus laevis TaxID=8355 RepID=A0A974HQU0_XENLA|nr:hypothetical protein XELAEV_18020206mg [Xenopus laevis]